jgi:hypothetical protein
VDQAALLGTNYIDYYSYYHNSLLSILNLDEIMAKNEVINHIEENYESSEINNLKIDIKSNEVHIDILLNHRLPFDVPIRFVTIKATTSAKLMVD